MNEYELDQLCDQNPQCDCNCAKCPLFEEYVDSQND